MFAASGVVVLGDAKNGIAERVRFFSSDEFFAAMHASGVRHVVLEMPRILGRHAMGVETDSDIEAFAMSGVVARETMR